MTRKKWNNLRRTRPELFYFLPSWEKMTHYEHQLLRPYSKAQAITIMTTYLLTSDYDEDRDMWASYPATHFNPAAPHPDKPLPPGPRYPRDQNLPDPAYPPQSYPPELELGKDCYLVDGRVVLHVEQTPP